MSDTNIVNNKIPTKKKTLLLSLGILLIGALVTIIIFLTEPEAEKEGATRQTSMLVEVVDSEKGDFHPTIVVTGVVTPYQEIILSPRVSGEIVSLSRSFVPGGTVKKGAVLLQIDPADYNNNLEVRKSELLQANANLELELGRQKVAKQDYELINDSISFNNKALILRKPQLNSAKAQVSAAKAEVHRAQLDLERTTIKAPFDMHILDRNVNVGSLVSPGENLGRIVGVDKYWIEATVPLSYVRWLYFPDKEGTKGSEVKLQSKSNWTKNEYRTGYLSNMVGALESQTRLVKVLITVPDPLSLHAENEDQPKLIIGAFMELQITTKQVSDVIRINRDYLRQNETVWVMEDGKLQIRTVEVKFKDVDYAYISKGLSEKDKIVATNLATVAEGEPLRIETTDEKVE